MFLTNKIRLMLAMCLLATSSLASALPGNGNNTSTSAFVDSVYEWGTWELGIAPAAGGPALMSNRPLNVRLPNIQFRPNDNAAFSPASSSIEPASLPPTGPLDTGITDLAK